MFAGVSIHEIPLILFTLFVVLFLGVDVPDGGLVGRTREDRLDGLE